MAVVDVYEYDGGDRRPMHRFCHSEDRQDQLELPQQYSVSAGTTIAGYFSDAALKFFRLVTHVERHRSLVSGQIKISF